MTNDARTKTWCAMMLWRSSAKNRGWLCPRSLHWRIGSNLKWMAWPRPGWRLWATLWCQQWQTLGPMSFPVAPFSNWAWFQAWWLILSKIESWKFKLHWWSEPRMFAENGFDSGSLIQFWNWLEASWTQLWVKIHLATALLMWLSPNLEQDHQAQTCVWLA